MREWRRKQGKAKGGKRERIGRKGKERNEREKGRSEERGVKGYWEESRRGERKWRGMKKR